jgi:hypothetical protein
MADGKPRYPYFGVPPTRAPRPASDEPALRGKRVILSMPDGFVYDMRACSEVYVDDAGGAVVDIASEQDWYRWMLNRQPPQRSQFPLRLVWVE